MTQPIQNEFREQLWAIDRLRFVEWLAVYLMIYGGEVPSSAWGRMYSSPPDVYKRGQHNITRRYWWEGLSLIETVHTTWKTCPECGKKYPETDEYWHHNAWGKAGLHSKCKYCRRVERREDYAKNRLL